MEHSKKLKSSSQFLTPQHLKKMIPQLLLSLSIFSFLFSYSSSSLYSSKSHYFSTNYFHPLKYALNKNCIFLICNGLLVFLAKTSGFVRSPPGLDLNDILLKPIGDDLQTATEPKDEKYSLDETARDFEDHEEENKGIDRCSSTQTPKEVSIFIEDLEDRENDEIIENESRKFWLFDDDDEQELYKEEVDDEEEDKERETELLSTEELNQKFEDFIRKMKEEIMINEAKQKQLVLVN